MTLKSRIIEVLRRITSTVEELDDREDRDELECWASDIDCMLDEMLGNDFFGTEGQSDPRGDRRDDEWSVMVDISAAL